MVWGEGGVGWGGVGKRGLFHRLVHKYYVMLFRLLTE